MTRRSRHLKAEKKVAHFTLATNENYKNADGTKVEDVTWHNIVAWNNAADIAAKYLKKGKEVAVEGRIGYHTYTDKNGAQKSVTEITVTDLLLLSSKKNRAVIDSSSTLDVQGYFYTVAFLIYGLLETNLMEFRIWHHVCSR